MSYSNRALLLLLLNTPGLEQLLVKNITSGELTLTAEGPGPLDRVRVVIQAGETINLLSYAIQSWWPDSESLMEAVDRPWIEVLDPDEGGGVSPSPIVPADIIYIPAPADADVGDLLYWDGNGWILLEPGTAGYVLTSNGDGVLPTYQVGGGGGGSGDSNTVTGQSTVGLADGDICYVLSDNTWSAARSDGTKQQATVAGANAGTAGTMIISGRVASAKFTTAGGSPSAGQEVYIAASADDGGSGTGKLTSTQPATGYLTVAGVCLSAANYAGLKTCVVILNPQSPIQL